MFEDNAMGIINAKVINPDGSNAINDILTKLDDILLSDGKVYIATNTATDDSPRRFESESKVLRDVLIKVKTHSQLFGSEDNQLFAIGVGEIINFKQIDISTLYFKNETAGKNGTIDIFGVE